MLHIFPGKTWESKLNSEEIQSSYGMLEVFWWAAKELFCLVVCQGEQTLQIVLGRRGAFICRQIKKKESQEVIKLE